MNKSGEHSRDKKLAEHFFRTEYGKIVAVITKYIGTERVETAEDIVQETLLKAVDSWQQNGIPDHPEAWLYTTAKNITFNILKHEKVKLKHLDSIHYETNQNDGLQFTEKQIADEQLNMMFACCHPSIPEETQTALILKILCGFSISEIADSFFSSTNTVNKRLVRGRKQLKAYQFNPEDQFDESERYPVVLKTIYLMFNEGYSPSRKNQVVRYELCLEAIRLAKILLKSENIKDKFHTHALLSLMYFNASRFSARVNNDNSIIEMEYQNRSLWHQEFIQLGIEQLDQAIGMNKVSKYLVLAAISANHCVADSFETTNWQSILQLYDQLIKFEDSPIIRLNRSVALSKIKGHSTAIRELHQLDQQSDIGKHYLFHSTLAELYIKNNEIEKAIDQLNTALKLTENTRDYQFLKKKLSGLVPIS